MKRLVFIDWLSVLLVTLASFIVSCTDKYASEDVPSSNILETRGTNIGLNKYYPIVPIMEEWKSFKTDDEMWKACQLNNEVLFNLSTKELADACMEFPLAYNYIAYDDQIEGIFSIFRNFNGLQELARRTDMAEVLLDIYKKIDFTQKENMKSKINNSLGLSLGYLELLFSTDNFLDGFSDHQLTDLANAAKDKFKMKLQHFDYFGNFCLYQSLVVCAGVKMKQNKTISEDERQFLESFIHFYPIFPKEAIVEIQNLLLI